MTTSKESKTLAMATLYLRSKKLTADVISKRLGLAPTRTQEMGGAVVEQFFLEELLPEARTSLKFEPFLSPSHYFILEVQHRGDNATDDSLAKQLEAVINELLNKIEPVVNQLSQLRGEVSANLICTYGCHNKTEWLRLSSDVLRRIVELDLPLMVCLVPLK